MLKRQDNPKFSDDIKVTKTMTWTGCSDAQKAGQSEAGSTSTSSLVRYRDRDGDGDRYRDRDSDRDLEDSLLYLRFCVLQDPMTQ